MSDETLQARQAAIEARRRAFAEAMAQDEEDDEPTTPAEVATNGGADSYGDDEDDLPARRLDPEAESARAALLGIATDSAVEDDDDGWGEDDFPNPNEAVGAKPFDPIGDLLSGSSNADSAATKSSEARNAEATNAVDTVTQPRRVIQPVDEDAAVAKSRELLDALTSTPTAPQKPTPNLDESLFQDDETDESEDELLNAATPDRSGFYLAEDEDEYGSTPTGSLPVEPGVRLADREDTAEARPRRMEPRDDSSGNTLTATVEAVPELVDTPSMSDIQKATLEDSKSLRGEGRANRSNAIAEATGGKSKPAKKKAATKAGNRGFKSPSTTKREVDGIHEIELRESKRTPQNGKLSAKELQFFSNLSLDSAVSKLDASAAELLRAPVSMQESPKRRKQREMRIAQALAGGGAALERGSRARFNEKDKQVLEFLALFRYGTAKQISMMLGVKEDTAAKRLQQLGEKGLVTKRDVYGLKGLWILTSVGMILSGYDLPRTTESKLTYSMIPHQFTVNHVAANLWGAGLNVLNEEVYPPQNRLSKAGNPEYGDLIVSELEIQSSFGKLKMFDQSSFYKPQILENMARQFQRWQQAGGPEAGPSPEFVHGNEYMWTLFPPASANLAYHVPDLVIKRPRNADGSPNSIAVEVEISNKNAESYARTMEAYRTERNLYKEVVWVCKTISPARKIEKITKENGMWQEGRVRIVPIYTADGVFRGRDLWTL